MKVPTFALGLQPGAIAGQKGIPRPPYEQRLVEIIRDKASLTREVRFFRTVYQATEEMQDRIRSVVQDLEGGFRRILDHQSVDAPSSSTTTAR